MKNSIKRVQSESNLSALSSVRILREAKKIFQYILMAVAVVATASCTNELDDTLQPANNGTLQFVVSDFPMFGEGTQTRVIGTQDEGKTAWVENDEIIVTLNSPKYGTQYATLIYNGYQWNLNGSLLYLENEKPTVCAYYAPCYMATGNTKELKTGMLYGMTEYLVASDCQVVNNTISISFDGVTRDYSRLRIAGLEKQTLTVTTTGFTPAGATTVATAPTNYTLTTDNNGNAFLYGVFSEGATVSVKHGDVVLKDYTFTAEKNPNGTEHNKSYALDARPIIDGTLGGKATAEESDITELMNTIKNYVDNGITTIIVSGSELAMIDGYTAIGTAIFSLSGEGLYSEDNQYNGKIDLIFSDVTEIGEWEFYAAYALNSITLPQVTKLGDNAFYDATYLRTITFDSVLAEVNETYGVFHRVGEEVDGCDLILNCGQMNESSVPTPDLTTNTWKFKVENKFNSITLIHTGECDECKANQ